MIGKFSRLSGLLVVLIMPVAESFAQTGNHLWMQYRPANPAFINDRMVQRMSGFNHNHQMLLRSQRRLDSMVKREFYMRQDHHKLLFESRYRLQRSHNILWENQRRLTDTMRRQTFANQQNSRDLIELQYKFANMKIEADAARRNIYRQYKRLAADLAFRGMSGGAHAWVPLSFSHGALSAWGTIQSRTLDFQEFVQKVRSRPQNKKYQQELAGGFSKKMMKPMYTTGADQLNSLSAAKYGGVFQRVKNLNTVASGVDALRTIRNNNRTLDKYRYQMSTQRTTLKYNIKTFDVHKHMFNNRKYQVPRPAIHSGRYRWEAFPHR